MSWGVVCPCLEDWEEMPVPLSGQASCSRNLVGQQDHQGLVALRFLEVWHRGQAFQQDRLKPGSFSAVWKKTYWQNEADLWLGEDENYWRPLW